jgi:hypothetical protein
MAFYGGNSDKMKQAWPSLTSPPKALFASLEGRGRKDFEGWKI